MPTTTPAIEWRPYSRASELTPAEIEIAEKQLCVVFPHDFVELMSKHQGMAPKVPSFIRVGERRVHLGSLMVLGSPEAGRNILELVSLWRKQGYPARWMPFARVGGAPHLALDFTQPELPTIVYLYPDAESEDTGFWGLSHVANSVEEMLRRVETE